MPSRIAVVHEWLIDWAGSEKVVEQILACFPNADLFALIDFLPQHLRHKLQGKHAKTTFLQHMPLASTKLRYYLPWMPIAIEQLDLSGYDVIISSSHTVAKGIITGPDQLHISYIHSPMRYAWDLQGDYLQGKNGRGLRGAALKWILHYLRQWDLRTVNSVDHFVANSSFVAKRINKFYRRDATVIYPPVNIDSFPLCEVKENFYLCAGRLERYKRIDIVVEAFKQMPDKKLIVMGDGPELQSLKKNATQNIEFIGYQTFENWLCYLQQAKALVFPGIEDFGITPVEAQACGTPVIAYARGGALETVRPVDIEQPTGILFNEQSFSSLLETVKIFEEKQHQIEPRFCRRNAERFGIETFKIQFQQLVGQYINVQKERS